MDKLEETLKEKEEVIQLLKVKIVESDERNSNIVLELKRVFKTVKTNSAVIVKEALSCQNSELKSTKTAVGFDMIMTLHTSPHHPPGTLSSSGEEAGQCKLTQH